MNKRNKNKVARIIENSFCVSVSPISKGSPRNLAFVVIPDGPGYDIEKMRIAISSVLKSEGFGSEWKDADGVYLEVWSE